MSKEGSKFKHLQLVGDSGSVENKEGNNLHLPKGVMENEWAVSGENK